LYICDDSADYPIATRKASEIRVQDGVSNSNQILNSAQFVLSL
jgi:hypothetical protein